MEQTTNLPEKTLSKTAGPSGGIKILGFILALPALILGLATVFLPFCYTVYLSLQKTSLIGNPKFIGFENYVSLFKNGSIGSAAGNLLMILAVVVVQIGITAALAGFGATWLGKKVRLPVRLLMGLPLVFYAPILFTLCWRVVISHMSNKGSMIVPDYLDSQLNTPWFFAMAASLFVFGLAGSLSSLFALSAGRGQTSLKRLIFVSLGIWIICLLGTISLVIQDIYFPNLAGAASSRFSLTPAVYMFKITFQSMQAGLGASLVTLICIAAGILGLLATILVAAGGFKISLGGSPETDIQRKTWPGWVILAIGLVFWILISLSSLQPIIWTFGYPLPAAGWSNANSSPSFNVGLFVTQVLPVWLVQIPLVYLAALGIGGLRPLGKASEWLLVLFGGGLFLTFLPLNIAYFVFGRAIGILNSPLAMALPGFMLNVPMLVILTLFFKGQQESWMVLKEEGGKGFGLFMKKMVQPSLPLVFLLGLAVSLATVWDISWPLTAASKPDMMPLSLQLYRLAGTQALNPTLALQMVLPQWIFTLIVLIPAQIFYLDRLEVK